MNITLEEIQRLHKKYAVSEEIFQIVYAHCEIVWEMAKQLIDKGNLDVDQETVQFGALLHDIGAYKLIIPGKEWDEKNYIKHGVLGFEILANEGVESSLCEIARRHTGVGITKEDIQKNNLPLPLADYTARTTEERFVMYADKFHSKTPRFNSFESYSKYVLKFGEGKQEKFRKLSEEFGIPELDMLSKKYKQQIV